MPMYFFNVRIGTDVVADPEGVELASPEVARAEALADARELMSEAVLRGRDISEQSFEITDDAGRLVLAVSFADAITRPGRTNGKQGDRGGREGGKEE